MTKKIFPYITILMLALFVGACSSDDLFPDVGTNIDPTSRTLTIKASMPSEDDPSTRVSAEELSGGKITLEWEENDSFKVLFVQGDERKQSTANVVSINGKEKNATFTLEIPSAINVAEPYDLIGVYGGEGDINPENGEIKVATAATQSEQNVGKNIMLHFKQTVAANATTVGNVQFENVGFLFTAKIKFANNVPDNITSVKLLGPAGNEKAWAKESFFNVEGVTFRESTEKDHANLQFINKDTVNNILTVRGWFPATREEWPAVRLGFNNGTKDIVTAYPKPARTPKVGKAYYLFADFDGSKLVFTDKTYVEPGVYITGDATVFSNEAPASALQVVTLDGDVKSYPELIGIYTWLKAGGSFDISIVTELNNRVKYGKGEETVNEGAVKTYTLQQDGTSFSVDAAGMYYVVVNTATKEINILPVPLGVSGAATPNGWNGETPLGAATFDEASLTATWTGNLNISPGEYKFRYGGDWGYSIDYDASTKAKLFTDLGVTGEDMGPLNDGGFTDLKPGGENITTEIGGEFQFTVKYEIRSRKFSATYEVIVDPILPIELPSTMYVIGSPFDPEWNWDKSKALTPVHGMAGAEGSPGGVKSMYWMVQYFNADDEVKFNFNKDWDNNDFGFSAVSDEAIAFAEITDGGGNIKVGKAGWYIVTVTTTYNDDETALVHTVDFHAPDIYLIGNTIGSWDPIDEAIFTVPETANGEFVSPEFVAADELRISAVLEGIDWRKTEFIILDGKIEYRGNGDDQERVKVSAGQQALLNFSDGTGKISGDAVDPVDPIIETEYYLIGDINGWNFENLDDYKFKHSGKDVYEDPIFTILVNNLKGNFKIAPKSSKEAASWDGVLGNPIDGNTELSGDIVLENAGAMQVTEPGWVKITLNMMEYTYNIEIIGEMALELYVPGAHQGWSPETAPSLYNRNFDFKYDGYVYFGENNTEFKFTTERNWSGPAFGDGGDGTLSGDGGNLVVSEAGMYRIIVDLSGNPVYSMEKTVWGLIGDATEGGWDNSTPMTYDPATQLWSVITTLKTGTFKFRANNGWDINLGGDINNLGYGDDNINIEAGTYKVSLDLSNSKVFKGTIVKQ